MLSVVSAHAFKGHTGGTGATTARAPATQSAPRRAPIQVPGPQSVPAISGAPAPLQPPPAPPDAAASSQPAPAAPPPPVSGGS